MFRNELIKAGIQKSFETGTSKIADRICYGYSKTSDGGLTINKKEAQIVLFIFDRYLSGESLGKIADTLTEKKVASPSGKDKWSRKVVDGLLSNEKYVGQVLLQKTIIQDDQQVKNNIDSRYLLTDHHPAIISKDIFDAVQAEKARRSNLKTTESGSQRKATKYNSGNVLSGLLICEECGSPYRRITRSGGEVVWRCANRVEHGKAYCKDSVTVTDEAVKEYMCGALDMPGFDEQTVRNSVNFITVRHEGSFEITCKKEPVLSMTL
ncbi:recombinase family protein [Desulfoscipio sp. XC116]|uniref:recombinase family protein n=1 Tax=Desulfoscipio sp. XC116 TaxID=3144975 RepID=UPI00325A4496